MADMTQDLYRACKRSAWAGSNSAKKETNFAAGHGAGSLYPEYAGFTRRDGSFRGPDVTSFTDGNGDTFVKGVSETVNSRQPYRNEGVSLNTTAGKFGYTGWFYFLLPIGTKIPGSLDVSQTGNDANHYGLRCVNRMRKDAYEGALDTFARGALAKSVEDARQALYFSA